MEQANEREMLITISVRGDAAYPGRLFLSLRQYDLNAEDPPTDTFETVSLEEALDVVGRWARSLMF